MKGFYTIYEVTHSLYEPNESIAHFQKISNVREYIEANCPNLDEVRLHKVNGENTPYHMVGNRFIHDYVPITSKNTHNYTIQTYGSPILKVQYTKFDD